ncbi:MAG: YitT family protein [Actinomycetota bacterium]
MRSVWSIAARFAQLIAGLVLYGFSAALLVRARLGLDPWDVFHQGLARHSGLAIGTWIVIVGVAVLLLWIPLRQRPGIGTLCNAVLIGITLNVALDHLPEVHGLPLRWAYLLAGIVLCGIATGAYIGAQFGPGPRDGLMVGLAGRGHSIRVVRTAMEATVLVTGAILGGTVGPGTVLFALTIGPIAHVTIPALSWDLATPTLRSARARAARREEACASG